MGKRRNLHSRWHAVWDHSLAFPSSEARSLDFHGLMLTGRTEHVHQLEACLRQTTEEHIPTVIEVSGPPGAGKWALIDRLVGRMDTSFSLLGRYSRFKYGQPLGGVFQCYADLARQLSTGARVGDRECLLIVDALRTALGDDARVVVDLVPSFADVVGDKLPAAPPLRPTQARARLYMLLVKIVRVVAAHADRPVVMLMRDMQWADAASVDVLTEIVHASIENLALVLMCGERGIAEDNPQSAVTLRASIEAQHTEFCSVVLNVPSREEITDAFAVLFGRDKVDDDVRELATYIYELTQGNLFFEAYTLASLIQDGLLVHSDATATWTWDVGAIRARAYPNALRSFLITRIERFPPTALRLLQIAAAYGRPFTFEVLRGIAGVSGDATRLLAMEWQGVLESGMVCKRGQGELVFIHDEVSAAVYEMLDEDTRNSVHQAISLYLLGGVGKMRWADVPPRQLFDIVCQLNLAALEPRTRLAVRAASLNLRAAKITLQASGYAAARHFAEAGIVLLGGESTFSHESHRELALDLAEVLAQTLFLLHDFDETDAHIQRVLAKTSEKRRVWMLSHTRICSYSVQTKAIEAISLGLSCARDLFGLELVPKRTLADVEMDELTAVDRLVQGRTPEELLRAIPVTDDWEVDALATLLVDMAAMAYISQNMPLYVQLTAVASALCLARGLCGAAGSAFSILGFSLHAFYHRSREACRMAELGRRVVDMLDAGMHMPAAYFHEGALAHLHAPNRAAVDGMAAAFHVGLRQGDVAWTTWSVMGRVWTEMCGGLPLTGVLEQVREGYPFVHHAGNMIVERTITGAYVHALRLMGVRSEGEHALWWENVSVTNELAFSDISHYTFQLLNCVLFHDVDGAVDVLRTFGPQMELMRGTHPFHSWMPLSVVAMGMQVEQISATLSPGLALSFSEESDSPASVHVSDSPFSAAFPVPPTGPKRKSVYEPPAAQAASLVKLMRSTTALVKVWADAYPGNYGARAKLCEAEVLRACGKLAESLPVYSAAWHALPHDGALLHVAGLIKERQCEVFQALGMPEMMAQSLRTALSCYAAWDAHAKVDDLCARYPQDVLPTGDVHAMSMYGSRTQLELGEGSALATLISSIDIDVNGGACSAAANVAGSTSGSANTTPTPTPLRHDAPTTNQCEEDDLLNLSALHGLDMGPLCNRIATLALHLSGGEYGALAVRKRWESAEDVATPSAVENAAECSVPEWSFGHVDGDPWSEDSLALHADARDESRVVLCVTATRRPFGEALELRKVNSPLSSCADLVPLAMCRAAMKTGEVLFTKDASLDRRFRALEYVRDKPVLNALVIPLHYGGAVIGALYLESSKDKDAISYHHATTLTSAARSLSAALSNALRVAELTERVQTAEHRLGSWAMYLAAIKDAMLAGEAARGHLLAAIEAMVCVGGLAKRGSGSKGVVERPVDMSQLLERVETHFAALYGDTAALTVRNDAAHAVVTGDQDTLVALLLAVSSMCATASACGVVQLEVEMQDDAVLHACWPLPPECILETTLTDEAFGLCARKCTRSLRGRLSFGTSGGRTSAIHVRVPMTAE